MIKPNSIILGDCLEVMKNIPDKSIDLVLTDPPYFKAIKEKWDNCWKDENDYLKWCEKWFSEIVRVLKDKGSFYCFGNFDILTKQKINIFDKKMFFRQNITLNKGIKSIAGRTSEALRMFPTASEHCLFYVFQDGNFLKDNIIKNINPFSKYLKEEFKNANVSIREISKLFPSKTGNVTGCVSNWINGENVITKDQYLKIRNYLNNKFLRKEYKELRKEYEELRFTFNLPFGYTDVWDFCVDKNRFDHPTQKPISIIKRIISASSNKNDLILDPFAGSGTTAIACHDLDRKFICIEKEPKYHEIATQRYNQHIAQQRLF